MKAQAKKVILLILDGWGIGPEDKHNAIHAADTPNFDRLIREYPNTSLRSDGLAVGLEEGQFGTSEINHLTIGSGRIILQDLPRINHAIANGEFHQNPAILKVINHVQEKDSRLHLVGILSDGGVHSNIHHLFAIFDTLAKQNFTQPVYLHIFSDGRDTPPQSIEKYLKMLQGKMAEVKQLNIKIATMQGRYFLDRDRDWAVTEKACDLMLHAKGNLLTEPEDAINLEYNQQNKDEFFGQYVFDEDGKFAAHDGMIMYHYRTDRLYQIVKRVLDEEIPDFELATFVQCSEEFAKVHIAFPRLEVRDTLAEVLANNNKRQLHIAETEKYPHVTYFFNGEQEKEFSGENWHLIQSNRWIKPRYNFEPSMRNFEIAQAVIEGIEGGDYDFILANFSSPDMVGHTGNFHAAVVSAEAVDFCLGQIYEAVKDKLDDYVVMITADHGNSDVMWDEKNKQPHTQHTLSKVPFLFVSNLEAKLDRAEGLENIAPTILELLRLDKPAAMTGTSLLI